MGDGSQYDVFLSHNSRDKPAVEILARKLQDEGGLRPFFDKWHLVPGEPWQEALEEALDDSNACAVFIGPSEISSWENEEMRRALDTRVRKKSFRVVPVLLPGAILPDRGTLPRFLSRLTWVDFRGLAGLDDPDAFHRLVAGIRGVASGRDSSSSFASHTILSVDPARFENDIYISYAHADNQPFTAEQQGWVTRFHKDLERELNQRLGRNTRIWIDTILHGNSAFAEEIRCQVSVSAVFIAVISPSYCRSEWLKHEASEFTQAAQETGAIIVPVIKMPLSDRNALRDFPDELSNSVRMGYDFYFCDENQTPTTLGSALDREYEQVYYKKVRKLASDIAQMFQKAKSTVSKISTKTRLWKGYEPRWGDVPEQYENDIYISYSTADNQQGWIARFHEDLERQLNQRLGRNARIFRDHKLQGKDTLSEVAVKQIRKTSLFIVIITRSYTKSKRCIQEAEEIFQSAQQTGGVVIDTESRIFKLIKMPIGDDEQAQLYPAMNDTIGYEFYTVEDNEPVELDPGKAKKYAQAYERKVRTLARDMAKLLERLAKTDL